MSSQYITLAISRLHPVLSAKKSSPVFQALALQSPVQFSLRTHLFSPPSSSVSPSLHRSILRTLGHRFFCVPPPGSHLLNLISAPIPIGIMSNAAVVQDGFQREDPLSTLKLVSKPIPTPSAGQVVVNVKLRTIHLYDVGTIRHTDMNNGTPGCEGYGIVHEVGEGVTNLHKGQRVVPYTAMAMARGNGSWQEYISLDEDQVWPVPDEFTDDQAAQFTINPWTAYSMLREFGEVPKGEYLIQSAAGSTLGRIVIGLARHWGIKLINVVRRAEQKEELKALGADEVICSTDEDVEAKVKEVTAGKGAWGGMDPVGGTMTQTLAACTRGGGVVFVYGMLSGSAPSVDLKDLQREVHLKGYALYKVFLVPEKRNTCAAEVAALMKDGVIKVAEVEKFELGDFRRAIARAEEAPSTVKVVLATA